jgi:hypothetical protein
MSRPPRVTEGGVVDHLLNRANACLAFFDGDADYGAFERTLAHAVGRYEIPLLTYCIMPNHFHLVDRAERWRWGSLWRQVSKESPEAPTLSPWPIDRPHEWIQRVNAALRPAQEEALARALRRGQPFGEPDWQAATAARPGLGSTLRPTDRPKRPKTGSRPHSLCQNPSLDQCGASVLSFFTP